MIFYELTFQMLDLNTIYKIGHTIFCQCWSVWLTLKGQRLAEDRYWRIFLHVVQSYSESIGI